MSSIKCCIKIILSKLKYIMNESMNESMNKLCHIMPFISCISCPSLWIDSSRIPEVTRALQVNWPWDEAYGIISRPGDLCNDNVHSLKDTASNANMDSVKAERRVHPVSSMCRRQSMAQVFRIWDCSSQERVCWLLVLNSVRRSS